MKTSVDQFVESLRQSGLFAADELDASLRDLTPPPHRPDDGDARELARSLVQQQKLTPYQAKAIYEGKLGNLFLGNYEILDRIGAGGMGTVFKARHRVMKRVVAIKLLPRKAVADRQAVKRFRREVRTAAKLTHANIVAALDADEVRGTHFLVMEYVDGSDLDQYVKANGPLSIRDAIDCLVQAARGLEHAHETGIIHRDVKPSNLLIDTAGTVKVLDMGLARATNPEVQEDSLAQSSITSTGAVMGTVDFMAPEQAVDSKVVDHRADVYSLGCTLFFLLTGRKPFRGSSPMHKLMAHQQQPPPSLRDQAHGLRPVGLVPQRLEAVYQKMVAKEPADRYASMTALIDALQLVDTEPRTDDAPKIAVASANQAAMQEFQQFLAGLDDSQSLTTTIPKLDLEAAAVAKPDAGGSKFTPRHYALLSLGTVAALLAALGLWAWGGGSEETSSPEKPSDTVTGAGDRKSKAKPSPKRGGPQKQSEKQPPPIAKAPFDAATAKKHQQAWADYLGLPVDKEVALPGGAKMTFVLIPPGEFLMGTSDKDRARLLKEAKANDDKLTIRLHAAEGPQHRVRITQPFYMGRYEVTQDQWQAVMGNNPARDQDPAKPAQDITWPDIQPFLEKLNQQYANNRMMFALPTEAQWEYACRAGTTTAFSFGDDAARFEEFGWCQFSGRTSHAVGQLKPNAWGLHDMHGNVHEWCADWFDKDYYAQSPVDDPPGPAEGTHRSNRGGGWARNLPVHCRSALRFGRSLQRKGGDIGFRLILTIPRREGARSEQFVWQPGPAENALPGLISRPARLPGIKRWNVEAVTPRTTVNSVDWSPDDKHIAVASADGQLRVFDAETGKLVQMFSGHTAAVNVVRWSPDGKWIATGSNDNTARLWSFRERKPGPVFKNRSHVKGLDWNPDGKRLACATYHSGIRIWDVETSSVTRVLKPTGETADGGKPKFICTTVAWSPDGKHIAVNCYRFKPDQQPTVQVWKADADDPPKVFEGYGLPHWGGEALTWHPDSRRIMTVKEGRPAFLDIEAGEPKLIVKSWAQSMSLSPNGRYLVNGYKHHWFLTDVANREDPKSLHTEPDNERWTTNKSPLTYTWASNSQHVAMSGSLGVVEVWNIAGDKPKLTLGTPVKPASGKWYAANWARGFVSVTFSGDGERLATGSGHHRVRLWDAETGQPSAVFEHADGVKSADFGPDDRTLVTVQTDGIVRHWVINSKDSTLIADASDDESAAHVSPDRRMVAVVTPQKKIEIRRAEDGTLSHTASPKPVPKHRTLRWGPQGKRLAWIAEDDTIRIFSLAEKKIVETITPKQPPRNFSWSPDGEKIGAVDEKSIRIWARGEEKPATVIPTDGPHNGPSWSSDGRRIFTVWASGPQGIISSWDVASGRELWRVKGTNWGWPTCGPDGKLVAANSQSGEINVFSADDGKELASITAHMPTSHPRFDFSPNGKRLATAGKERTLRMWNPRRGEQLWLAVDLPAGEAATFSPAGKLLHHTDNAEQELAWVVENADGTLETLTRRQFLQRTGLSKQAAVRRESPNYALSFDGKDDSVVVTSLENLDEGPLTIEAIVREVPKKSEGYVLRATGRRFRTLSVKDGVYWAVENGVDLRLTNTKGPSNRWVHIAAVFGSNVRLFVNGRPAKRAKLRKGRGNAARFQRGDSFFLGGNGFHQFQFRGQIREVRLSRSERYRETFTPPQILSCDEQTLALYDFDEGRGDVLKDSSGNGHHGKIDGATWVKEIAPGQFVPGDAEQQN